MVKIRLDFHRFETEFAFYNIQDYFDMIEGQLDAVRKLEEKKIPQNPPPGLSEEEYADWQSEISWFEERYERDFPSKVRYSFLVLLYIIVETRLRDTCNEITKRKNLVFEESDFRGSAIERVKIFLNKAVKIPACRQETWQGLKDFQKIRDCIVHTNGQIEKSKKPKRIKELCTKDIGLLDDAGTLIVKREYCTKALKIAQEFFDQMLQAAEFGPPFQVVEE